MSKIWWKLKVVCEKFSMPLSIRVPGQPTKLFLRSTYACLKKFLLKLLYDLLGCLSICWSKVNKHQVSMENALAPVAFMLA